VLTGQLLHLARVGQDRDVRRIVAANARGELGVEVAGGREIDGDALLLGERCDDCLERCLFVAAPHVEHFQFRHVRRAAAGAACREQ